MFIFQGTDATVEDSFAPQGPPLLPWEGDNKQYTNRRTSRLLDRIGPVGRFGGNSWENMNKNNNTENFVLCTFGSKITACLTDFMNFSQWW